VPGDFTALYPAIFRNVGYVGDGGWLDLIGVGDAGRYVGRPVTQFVRVEPAEGSYAMNQDLTDVPEGTYRPVAVGGRFTIEEGTNVPEQVLIAIDGRVAGVADVEPEQGEYRFYGLVDERRVQPGEHEVGLYLPVGRRGLQPIGGR
jgi:hypothetical protein